MPSFVVLSSVIQYSVYTGAGSSTMTVVLLQEPKTMGSAITKARQRQRKRLRIINLLRTE